MAEAIYGGFWIRTLAYSADVSILMIVLIGLAVPLVFMGGAGMALYSAIALIGPIAYFAWFTASDRQATFGKQLCGLKVQNSGSGEGISLLRSLGRELAKLVSAAVLMIGFLLAAFTPRKQGLHDTLASTVVVREGQPRIVLAILVALAGVVIPAIVIPLMFAGMFAGLMAMMMGTMMGEMEVKQTKPAPQMEQKAAPRPQAAAAQPAPAPKPATAAAEDPETVYRKYRQSQLDSDEEGMRKRMTKDKGDELAKMSAAEKKMMFGMMGLAAPKTFQVRNTELSADGGKATLHVTAEQVDKGKTETIRATVTLLKEAGAWKVDFESWGGDQPSGSAPQSAAAKPAAIEPAKPATIEPPKPIAVEPPKPAAAPVVTATPSAPAPQPRAAPRRTEPAVPVQQQSRPPCVYKPVMTDEEIRNCR